MAPGLESPLNFLRRNRARVRSLVDRANARRDHWRFLRRFPELAPDAPSARTAIQELTPSYQRYARYSSGPSPASLETACLLYRLAVSVRACRMLDLGSGFSSHVLRRYAQGVDAHVVSVETDPGWLAKTGEFLAEEGTTEGELLTWHEFTSRTHAPFDLIFSDIAPIPRRHEEFERFLGLLAPAGIMIIDDYHKVHLRRPLDRELRRASVRAYDLKRLTRDGYGRYAVAVMHG